MRRSTRAGWSGFILFHQIFRVLISLRVLYPLSCQYFVVLKMLSAFFIYCIYIQITQEDFYHGSNLNTMKPDQTAPYGSSLIWVHIDCTIYTIHNKVHWQMREHREGSGSVVKCLTRDQGAVGSSLASVTVLCPWARHINPSLVLVQPIFNWT